VEYMRFLGQVAAKSGRIDQLQQVFMVSEGWMSIAHENKPPEMIPSRDPNRKEVLIISGMQIQERKKHMKVFEILRDSSGKATDLEEFLPDEEKDNSVDVPLLDAFVDGFQMAFRIRYN